MLASRLRHTLQGSNTASPPLFLDDTPAALLDDTAAILIYARCLALIMLYLKPLHTITQNELQAAGYKAQDLALLSQHQLPTAPTFLILSTALDETIRRNNLKYKIDYILSHAQLMVHQSLVNTYNSVRKAYLESALPPGLETELREMYDQITRPLSVGELVATNDLPPVRIVLSMNRLDDPENNDTVIQNINSYEELVQGVKEAWALSFHPSQFAARLKEKFPENRLKVALLVQTMERADASAHVYSCLPQDHHKIYLQAYNGYPDMREKIAKDYYAVSKENFTIIATQISQQTQQLERNENKELIIAPVVRKFEMIERDILELARLTKKSERLLKTPVKAFFTSKDGDHNLLWVNRLGFDIMLKDEDETKQESSAILAHEALATPEAIMPAPAPETPIPSAQELLDTIDTPEPTVAPSTNEDFITIEPTPETKERDEKPTEEAPKEETTTPAGEEVSETAVTEPSQGVAAKLLRSSLAIIRQVVERKYRSAFGETPPATENISSLINRLNSASAFSRAVDGGLLLQAEEAAKHESHLSDADYAKTIGEVAFIMTYA